MTDIWLFNNEGEGKKTERRVGKSETTERNLET